MPAIHVYVREQVTGAIDDLLAIEHAVTALRAAVEAAGSDWHGGVSLSGDVTPPVVKPAAPRAVAHPVAHIEEDEPVKGRAKHHDHR